MADSTGFPSPSNAIPAAEAPRLNRRQAAKVRTRRKVMDAARALFAERGYEPATIRDIAKGAGMSTGAVFANFQDKAELFEAVLAEDIARLANDLRAGGFDTGTTRDRIVGGMSAAYHAALEHLPLVQAIVARAWFHPADAEVRLREHTAQLTQPLEQALRDGVGAGELRQDADVPLLTDLLWTAFVGNFRRAAYEGWDDKALSDRIGLQVDVALAGSLAR